MISLVPLILFTLYLGLWLCLSRTNILNLVEANTGLHQNSSTTPHQDLTRSLQSSPKLYIKVTDISYINKKLVLTIQDVCEYNQYYCRRLYIMLL
jgi:hypothetical protein